MSATNRLASTLAILIGFSISATSALADGTEILGFPGIELEFASGLALGGTGLFEEQDGGFVNLDGEIFVSVPQGADVKQVLLYWVSEHYPQSGPDTTAVVEGTEVQGVVIGGSTNFFSEVYFAAVRADITDLDLINPGPNTVAISGLDSSFRNTGAGIIVLYDDESSDDAYIADGLDLAYFRRDVPLDSTVPVGFEFEASNVDRVARLPLLVGSVGNGRPNVTRVFIGDDPPLVYNNLFSSLDGNEWDSLTLEVDVPAGESYLEVQLYSEGDGTGNPASMAWVAAGIDFAPLDGDGECSDCDGKVSVLTLRYTGDEAGLVTVEQFKEGVVFQDVVAPGEEFTLFGVDNKATLGPRIGVSVGCNIDEQPEPNGNHFVCDGVEIHTSCSVPIGPGLVAGDFVVVSGYSRNGGELCPVEEPECAECEGSVTELQLEYVGENPQANVFVLQKKGAGIGIPFSGTVAPGDVFTVSGVADDGSLGEDLYMVTDWRLNGLFDTSCDTRIGPGTMAGEFVVVSGESHSGAPLCPDLRVPDCDKGEPVSLTFEYTGASCDAQQHAQNLSTTQCIDDEQDPEYVYVIATDDADPWTHNDWNMLYLGMVNKGESFTIDAGASGLSKLRDVTALFIFDPTCQLIKAVSINSSCDEPLNEGDVFGPVTLTDFSTESEGGVVEPIIISH